MKPDPRYYYRRVMIKVQLIIQPLVFEYPVAKNAAGLKLTAKRYTTPASEHEGFTLLFTHCIASREFWYLAIVHDPLEAVFLS